MNLRVCALLAAFFALEVTSTPIIFRSGVGKLEDHGGGEGGNVYTGQVSSGLSNFDAGAGFDKDGQRKFSSAADTGKFGEEDRKKVEKVDQGEFGGKKFHKTGGGAVADFDQKSGHKKGHQKSGFHNTYKKDESGSKSSYFDGADDQGGRHNHASKQNSLGDTGARQASGHYLNGNAFNKDNARRGGYTNGGRFEEDHADRRNFNKERFRDDRKHAGRNNAASHYGGEGRQLVEEVHTPQYYQPFRGPIAPGGYSPQPIPRKIIEYEDPRIFGNQGYQDYDEFFDVKPHNAYHY